MSFPLPFSPAVSELVMEVSSCFVASFLTTLSRESPLSDRFSFIFLQMRIKECLYEKVLTSRVQILSFFIRNVMVLLLGFSPSPGHIFVCRLSQRSWLGTWFSSFLVYSQANLIHWFYLGHKTHRKKPIDWRLLFLPRIQIHLGKVLCELLDSIWSR